VRGQTSSTSGAQNFAQTYSFSTATAPQVVYTPEPHRTCGQTGYREKNLLIISSTLRLHGVVGIFILWLLFYWKFKKKIKYNAKC